MIELLKNRSVIHILGVDSEKFLQGQTTNDIIKNQYSYNYILNNQGRYLFDFFVFKENEASFYIDIDNDSADAFIKRLSMYKLRSDVELYDLSEKYCILYSKKIVEKSLFSAQDPRSSNLSFRSIVDRSEISEGEVDAHDLYLNDKFEYSIIDGSSELVYEKSIPIEYGAESMCAIDYQKGCYVGQEVISRAKYQGVIRKKIYKLKFKETAENYNKGDDVTDIDGNKLGILCSAYKNIALVLLREEKYLGLSAKIAMIEGQTADILVPSWGN